jgi:hypothetical protein
VQCMLLYFNLIFYFPFSFHLFVHYIVITVLILSSLYCMHTVQVNITQIIDDMNEVL